MQQFARYDFNNSLPQEFYKVELIMKPSPVQLPSLKFPFDLSDIMSIEKPPFLFAATSCRYWGQLVVDIHIDGAFSQNSISELEARITDCTAIKIDRKITEENIPFSSTELTQLLVAWRFLEAVNYQLIQKEKNKKKIT